jgi:chemotaxis protein methyltransferase WspC
MKPAETLGMGEIADLLNRTMGLDTASIGPATLERAVRRRRDACAAADPRAYLAHLKCSQGELQALIESVVVPETWFLRDREAFAALASLGGARCSRASDEVLRVLSLPCSTGEEPYSIAMTLLDAGLGADRFHVDAVDISAQALERARRAIYGRNSFRGSGLGFRDRHFEATPQGFRLRDVVRGQVRFRHGNLFAEILPPNADLYHVVFCRNVLIYFDRAGQDRAVGVLSRLLEAGGLLFVGSSESALLLAHGFVSLRLPLTFAFRKPGAGARVRAEVEPSSTRRSAVRASASRGPLPQPPAFPGIVPPGPRPRVPEAPAEMAKGLVEAGRLADQGHLAEAARQCEDHLARHGPSAQAYYLLGLVRDARGHPVEAAVLYRKALYLDPLHAESLGHLALLLEGLGDASGARAVLGRASRQAQKAGA